MTVRRAVLFDLDGTLLELQQPYSELLAETFEAVEGDTRQAWVEQYSEAFADLFGRLEPNPVRRAFASIEGCTDPDSLADELRRREIAACQPPATARETLGRLTESHAVGVLTNGMPEWQRQKLREHSLGEHAETVVTSYEAGAHKPAEAPYRLVEERVSARRYAIVGDSESDIVGANNAGWAAHRYTGGGFSDVPDSIDWG